jgi:hypothetical protein
MGATQSRQSVENTKKSRGKVPAFYRLRAGRAGWSKIAPPPAWRNIT